MNHTQRRRAEREHDRLEARALKAAKRAARREAKREQQPDTAEEGRCRTRPGGGMTTQAAASRTAIPSLPAVHAAAGRVLRGPDHEPT